MNAFTVICFIKQNTCICRLQAVKRKLDEAKHFTKLDKHLASDVHNLLRNASDPFLKLFYSEQLKMQRQHKQSRRFHPDIIK